MYKLLKSKLWVRSLWVILGLILALVSFGLLQLIEPIAIAPAQATLTQFSGRGLLVASDADMVATAYADAKLDRVAGIEDTLSLISLPLNVQPQVAEVRVSNSVMSWPHILAVSPDGRKAYVAEVRSRPADSIEQFDTIDQMPSGRIVSVIDIADSTQIQVIQKLEVGQNPEHLHLSPDGQLLAINSEEKGKELAIAAVQADGTLKQPTYLAMNIPGSANCAVTWHPSGKLLAVTTAYERQMKGAFVAFFQVQRNRETIEIRPYGTPIKAGNHLTMGKFTPDGKFFLVPDLKWRVRGQPQLDFLMNPKGELLAIGLNEQTRQPQVVSRLEVGLSPEGLAISPDGALAVTVNMRRTYLPNRLPAWRGRDRNSLSLVRINPDSGQLSAIAEYGFEGLLPEDAVFDAAGKSLAVVVYNQRILSPETGTVEFWNVVQHPKPRLERTRFKLEVVRGPHDLELLQ